ncbi:D-alanyl-lipoteichoic acid biosynthesis protein DltD [Leuconostoc fallax]|uniref:Protein DltD n=1 Tax=Leuconostoc fallax TaxID=1251 RepID=A0A4R5NA09_9LACO|nr:D-alanyl-lipoteichoic acid biosynthesis protein DltD [Leuconostoc fallax]MBU7456256.1 D-alanyl-lipoteichoic acid biosynthesis protein DltD [Leuconostoc fallax]TDG69081.1 hypothetical protein C5L23_001212 [Leuconostoc fallax]
MKEKRGLWWIFGPVIIAFIMVIFLFLAPFSLHYSSNQKLKDASVSFSKDVFKGQTVKMAAFNNKTTHYVPFFGSSELLRMDALHPAILAAKYHRSYQPFLLGMAGTQSLTHYLSMQGIQPALHKKQAVFVISQQWFTKQGMQKWAFDSFYSPLQTVQWLQQAKSDNATDQYVAQRLLSQDQIKSSYTLEPMVRKIKENKPLTKTDMTLLNVQKRMLLSEDGLFSNLPVGHNWHKKVLTGTKRLPEQEQHSVLEQYAIQAGEKATKNSRFGIRSGFYQHRVAPDLDKLRQSQTKFDYRESIEYADFQTVLQEFAKNQTDVMFVIQPVNKKWSNYTGLDTKMYQQSVDKVKHQLVSQGFTNIADLSKDGAKPYFMEDTIHIGWRGWLAADQKINPFLTKGYQKPNYRLNNDYLTKKWQNLNPTEKNLLAFQ